MLQWALIITLQGEPPMLMAAIQEGAECRRLQREFLAFKKSQGQPADAGCYLLINSPDDPPKDQG